MTDSCKILTELPLSTIILSNDGVGQLSTEITKASLWGKSIPLASYSVKSMIGPGTAYTA